MRLTRTQTRILKLFDRSVDLDEYPLGEDTPLYPVCRSWVHGHPEPSKIANGRPKKSSKQSPKLDDSDDIPSQREATNEPVNDLPRPKSKLDVAKINNLIDLEQADANMDQLDIRIPATVRNFKRPADMDSIIDMSIETMGQNQCLELNKIRWKKVKREWTEARRIHESRYEDSLKLLHDMFMTK